MGEPSENRDSADAARRPYSRLKQVVMISLVMWVLFVISGPITGPQATFGVIAGRGLFSSKCGHHTNGTATTTICAAQEHAIESATVLCLSLSNFLCVGWGFAQDMIGARKVAVISVALWIAAKSCAGFYPADGIVWTVSQSVAASAGLGAYSALGLEHLRQACVTDGLYAVMGFISSAAWDIAVILNLALAQLYGLEAITLWQAYMIYGLGAGVPVLAGLAIWPKPLVSSDADDAEVPDDPASSASSSPIASPAAAYGHPQHLHSPIVAPSRPRRGEQPAPFTIGEAVSYGAVHDTTADTNRSDSDHDDGKADRLIVEGTEHHDGDADPASTTASDVKTIFSTAIFWLFAAHCSVVVTVGYFMIANVGSLATSHGMHDRSAARDITTVMMSAIGVTSIVPGRILYALGTQRGLVVLMGIQMALLVSFGCLIAFGDETTFYLGFGLMYAWRVWGFGIAFPFIDWRFRQFGKGVGVCYGAVYGIGGGVSAIAGVIASSILHNHPQSATRPLVGALCAIAVVVELSFGIAIARTKRADMAHPPPDASLNQHGGATIGQSGDDG